MEDRIKELEKKVKFLMENSRVSGVVSLDIVDGFGKVTTRETTVGDLYEEITQKSNKNPIT